MCANQDCGYCRPLARLHKAAEAFVVVVACLCVVAFASAILHVVEIALACVGGLLVAVAVVVLVWRRYRAIARQQAALTGGQPARFLARQQPAVYPVQQPPAVEGGVHNHVHLHGADAVEAWRRQG